MYTDSRVLPDHSALPYSHGLLAYAILDDSDRSRPPAVDPARIPRVGSSYARV
nr:MAG TPA: hypothetical protein [Bacteriophage sp.]